LAYPKLRTGGINIYIYVVQKIAGTSELRKGSIFLHRTSCIPEDRRACMSCAVCSWFILSWEQMHAVSCALRIKSIPDLEKTGFM
jgi:hypothetical protein